MLDGSDFNVTEGVSTMDFFNVLPNPVKFRIVDVAPPDLVIVDDALAGGPFALGRVLPVLWRGRTVAVGSSLGHSWVIVGSSLGHRSAITCGVAERGQKGPKRAMLTLVPLVIPTPVSLH